MADDCDDFQPSLADGLSITPCGASLAALDLWSVCRERVDRVLAGGAAGDRVGAIGRTVSAPLLFPAALDGSHGTGWSRKVDALALRLIIFCQPLARPQRLA